MLSTAAVGARVHGDRTFGGEPNQLTAIVTAGNQYVAPYSGVVFLTRGTYTLQSPTMARVQLASGYVTELVGTFTYSNGALSAGTVIGVNEYWADGGLHYQATGLSYDVARLLTLQGETSGVTLMSELFGGDDRFFGGPLADSVAARAGNDTVVLGAGDDQVVAGAGNDSVAGGAGNDVVFSDDGNDFAVGDEGDDLLQGGAGDDTLYGFDGNDNISADAGNDVVNGNVGSDTLWGFGGADDLRGGRDNDILYGGDDSDPLLNGNIGNDTVYGGTGNDSIWGGQNEDRLLGENGNDMLSGDLGADTLTGGTGSDAFVFNAGGGNDVITDFSYADGDRIRLASTLSLVSVADSSAGAVLTLGQGTTVTLAGTQAAQVAADWITYA